MLGIEGAHASPHWKEIIENLNSVYGAAVRMIGPNSFLDNELGGSAHGEKFWLV